MDQRESPTFHRDSGSPAGNELDVKPVRKLTRTQMKHLARAEDRRFCGVVVITSALHAEGREFEPRQNLGIFCIEIT